MNAALLCASLALRYAANMRNFGRVYMIMSGRLMNQVDKAEDAFCQCTFDNFLWLCLCNWGRADRKLRERACIYFHQEMMSSQLYGQQLSKTGVICVRFRKRRSSTHTQHSFVPPSSSRGQYIEMCQSKAQQLFTRKFPVIFDCHRNCPVQLFGEGNHRRSSIERGPPLTQFHIHACLRLRM